MTTLFAAVYILASAQGDLGKQLDDIPFMGAQFQSAEQCNTFKQSNEFFRQE